GVPVVEDSARLRGHPFPVDVVLEDRDVRRHRFPFLKRGRAHARAAAGPSEAPETGFEPMSTLPLNCAPSAMTIFGARLFPASEPDGRSSTRSAAVTFPTTPPAIVTVCAFTSAFT